MNCIPILKKNDFCKSNIFQANDNTCESNQESEDRTTKYLCSHHISTPKLTLSLAYGTSTSAVLTIFTALFAALE
jgi:hypothetical protein